MKRLMLFVVVLSVLILTKGRAEKNDVDQSFDNAGVFSYENISDLKEIIVTTIPFTVREAVADDFKNAKICSAYTTSNGYYLIVLQTNQMCRAVYYGQDGKFVKDEISIPVY